MTAAASAQNNTTTPTLAFPHGWDKGLIFKTDLQRPHPRSTTSYWCQQLDRGTTCAAVPTQLQDCRTRCAWVR